MNDLLARFEAACNRAHAKVAADRGDIELGETDVAAVAPCPGGCGSLVRRMGSVPIAGSGLDLTPSGPWWCAACIQTKCTASRAAAREVEDAPVGWIVLTDTHGKWRDDWDGEVHKDRDEALVELAKAKAFCGDEAARLVRLAWDDTEAVA